MRQSEKPEEQNMLKAQGSKLKGQSEEQNKLKVQS